MGGRFAILIGFLAAAYGGLLFHLYDLQMAKGEYYQAKAGNQYSASGILRAVRGTVFMTDRNGNKTPTAFNKDFPIVYAVPKAIEDAPEAAHRLAQITGLSASDLEKYFGTNSSYKLLIKKANPEVSAQVEDIDLKGVYVDHVSSRYYPMGKLAAHLLGYVGLTEDDTLEQGRYGLEKFYDTELAGTPGTIADGTVKHPKPGQDITLTLDPNIQMESERTLSSLITKYRAKGGSVVIADPNTGKILAMTSLPTFDPNNYGDSPVANFLNPVIQKLYEPGSVFKVLTMAAAIDAGAVSAKTTYYDSGSLSLNGRTIKNWDQKAHGNVDMTTVIERSLNTGAAFAEARLGHEKFKSYLKDLGFSDKTGIDLPGELNGDMRRLMSKDVRAIAFATASYGQGIAVTPLQVLTSISAIANGGKLMRPYVNSEIEPKVIRQVWSEEAAQEVSKMMVSAVDKAQVAKIPGYSLAGKTGTAFVPDFKHGGYTDEVVNTYVGFGPASNPKFIILLKLDQPEGAPLAGLTVVPAFRDLAQFILNYYNIPPDRSGNGNP